MIEWLDTVRHLTVEGPTTKDRLLQIPLSSAAASSTSSLVGCLAANRGLPYYQRVVGWQWSRRPVPPHSPLKCYPPTLKPPMAVLRALGYRGVVQLGRQTIIYLVVTSVGIFLGTCKLVNKL